MPSRDYAVKASGHGSRFRFDGPPIPRLTLDEAIEQANRWILIADTIGGDAIVVHLPTGRQVWP